MLYQGLIGYGAGGAAAAAYTIDNSCVFDGAADLLTFTAGTPTDNNTWTFSCWLKISLTEGDNILNLLDSTSSNSVQHYVRIQTGKLRSIQYDSGYEMRLQSSSVYRDPSAWYHVVFVMDTSNGVSGDRTRMYINGVELTSFVQESQPSLNETSFINTASRGMAIGRNAYASGAEIGWMNGYLAEVIFIDGLALAASSFGETDEVSGNWIPKDPSTLTFGNNGCWLDFEDSSALGNDVSGNDNDWTTGGLGSSNQTTDSPTDSGTTIGNFCTWNPLAAEALSGTNPPSFSEGNLRVDKNASGTWRGIQGTMYVDSGKWYCEHTVTLAPYDGLFGISPNLPGQVGTVNDWLINATQFGYENNGKKLQGTGSDATYGDTYTTDDVIGMALDMDNGILWFSKNGTWQNSATIAEVAAGTDTNAAFSVAAITTYPQSIAWWGYGYSSQAVILNTNTGQRAFSYTVPTGFTGWCTPNIAAPAITDPSAHFGAVLYTGTGSARDVTWGGNTELTADYIVIKNRDEADEWKVIDRIRGVTKELNWDSTALESTDTDGLDDLSVTDGFGLGSGAGGYNDNTEKFVAFGWAAGGTTGALDESGTIDATISANPTAGFSYGTFTGTGSAGTIPHGLSSAPDFIAVKRTGDDSTGDWNVYHSANTAAPETDYLKLSDTPATADNVNRWNDTAPTASVFTVATNLDVNESGKTYTFFAFTSISSYSSFGSYTGNADADGPYIYTGFRPRWFLLKPSSAVQPWRLWDAAKDTYNSGTLHLDVDNTNAESGVNGDEFDFLAGGVKIRTSNSAFNGDGTTYIYLAFAENPFGGSGVSQARAR